MRSGEEEGEREALNKREMSERGRGGICRPLSPQIESQIEFPLCAFPSPDKVVLEKDALFSTIKFPPLLC